MEHRKAALRFLQKFEREKIDFIETLVSGGENIEMIGAITPALNAATQAMLEIGTVYNLKFTRKDTKK